MPILIPSPGPESWRQFLAKPDLQWEKGYSARTLAHSWEAANGLPPEVETIFAQAFGSIELLLAIPEHKTPLPGGRRASQADVFVLLRHSSSLVACTIEGKVDEPFGPTIDEFKAEISPGRQERLDFLCRMLGIVDCPGAIYYQLLHRTASALIEADRFFAQDAAMIVHSFSPDQRWLGAYKDFCTLLGCELGDSNAGSVTVPSGKRLVLGWAAGDQRYRAR